MTTVVNNPNGDGSGVLTGVIVALIVVVLGALFFMYGLPAIRGQAPTQENNGGSLDINVELPAGNNSGQAGQ